ncbi:VOC family protein [Saccharicrinis sp. FJH62]|uniref:VOC family protein n=1 Tax=Saccharicrinis sp. FJH62 TaxID=3344657 RepID=UPI0035D51466
MEVKLKHIALEVRESDINAFYVEILGGKILSGFVMKEVDADIVFNIKRKVKVCYVSLYEIEFELFVNEKKECNGIQHICLEMGDAEHVYKSALQQSYWCHLRTSGQGEAYFIKDANGNMFEIKVYRNE